MDKRIQWPPIDMLVIIVSLAIILTGIWIAFYAKAAAERAFDKL